MPGVQWKFSTLETCPTTKKVCRFLIHRNKRNAGKVLKKDLNFPVAPVASENIWRGKIPSDKADDYTKKVIQESSPLSRPEVTEELELHLEAFHKDPRSEYNFKKKQNFSNCFCLKMINFALFFFLFLKYFKNWSLNRTS